MARERDEYGRRKDDVDFDISLLENLEKLGVTIDKIPNDRDSGLRRWSIPGRVLGEFDAHYGWCLLRHYNLVGDWVIALREAAGEYHYGYDPRSRSDA
jgi:hypothetical protein